MAAFSIHQLIACCAALALYASLSVSTKRTAAPVLGHDENGVDVTWTEGRSRVRVAVMNNDEKELEDNEADSEERPTFQVGERTTLKPTDSEMNRNSREEEVEEENGWKDDGLVVNFEQVKIRMSQEEGGEQPPGPTLYASHLSTARPVGETKVSVDDKAAEVEEFADDEDHEDIVVPFDDEDELLSTDTSQINQINQVGAMTDDTGGEFHTQLVMESDGLGLGEGRAGGKERQSRSRIHLGGARRRSYRYHRTASQLPLGLSWWGRRRRK